VESMLPKEKLKYLRQSQSSKMFMEEGLGGVAQTLKKDAGENASGVGKASTEKVAGYDHSLTRR
jgi:hypothetical protein